MSKGTKLYQKRNRLCQKGPSYARERRKKRAETRFFLSVRLDLFNQLAHSVVGVAVLLDKENAVAQKFYRLNRGLYGVVKSGDINSTNETYCYNLALICRPPYSQNRPHKQRPSVRWVYLSTQLVSVNSFHKQFDMS